MIVVWLAEGAARACACAVFTVPGVTGDPPEGPTLLQLATDAVRDAPDVTSARVIEVTHTREGPFGLFVRTNVWLDVDGTSMFTEDTVAITGCSCALPSLPTPSVIAGATGWLVASPDGLLGWFPHDAGTSHCEPGGRDALVACMAVRLARPAPLTPQIP